MCYCTSLNPKHMEKRKQPMNKIEKSRSSFFLAGIVISLSLVFCAFEYRTYNTSTITDEFPDAPEVEQLPPITKPKPPPPPPPKIYSGFNLKDDVVEDPPIWDPEYDKNEPDYEYEPITIEPEPETEYEGYIYIAEIQANFPGGDSERMKFLQKNMRYPQMARESNIEGTVFLSFLVEKDGTITQVKVMRGIGGGCDEEAVRVLKSMPKWSPGKQRGRPVRLKMTMPIKFRLD